MLEYSGYCDCHCVDFLLGRRPGRADRASKRHTKRRPLLGAAVRVLHWLPLQHQRKQGHRERQVRQLLRQRAKTRQDAPRATTSRAAPARRTAVAASAVDLPEASSPPPTCADTPNEEGCP